MMDISDGWKRIAAAALLLATTGLCAASAGDVSGSPKNGPLAIYDNNGQHLKICSERSLEGTGTATGGNVGIRATPGELSAEKSLEVLAADPGGETGCRVAEWSWQDGTWRTGFPVEDGKLYRLQRAGTLGGVWVTIARLKSYQDGRVSLPDTVPEGTVRGFYRLAEGEETAENLYMLVDMSGGPDAAAWPVTYLDGMPDGGWTTDFKTSKLVLRRIEPGTFAMGSPEEELGRDDDETRHEVTLTTPYYMGVFEVTQRQWELAMGTRPSFFHNEECYATRPVEFVAFGEIRTAAEGAADWPGSDEVAAGCFLGVLRAKTGLEFTLPTEARWEYACRAGAATALNSGLDLTSTNACPHMAAVGRYRLDGGEYHDGSGDTTQGTAAVGSYAPNAWGLHDMHGNVWEWCLDWMDDYPAGTATDPVGPVEPSARQLRVIRGGAAGMEVRACRSATRGAANAQYLKSAEIGFRLCCGAGGQP